MDDNAKRFARKILAVHALLLLVVLATVAAAAREIYRSTREQMIAQAEDRQKLLAKQTASGIESHYQSILNDLDLLRRAETDETGAEKPTTEPAPEEPPVVPLTPEQRAERAAARAAGRRPPGSTQTQSLAGLVSSLFTNFGNRNPIIGIVMWKQLAGRVSLLFTMNHPIASSPSDEVHLIGSVDDHLNVNDIAQKSRAWIEQLKEPSISKFDQYNGVGGNLICIPMARGRDLVAVVPIRGIEKQFLQPLNDDPANGAWLIDEAGTAMAASRSELVGTNVTGISDPELHDLAREYIENHASGTQVVPRNFHIGNASFVPAMITAQPVTLRGKQWELFVTTSLDDVDGVVAKLFNHALLWCLFVVVSVTAILVSTSIQMIRTRVRMERVRHEVLTRELNQAREIQLAWLPDTQPLNDAVDIAAINSPASHISGDFYNWFELPDGRLVVTVGDVTGHGMAAAFLMATTQLLVRNTMVRLGDPGRCLEEVNRQLCVQMFNGQFVTMLVIIIDIINAKLQVATAGHPSPLVADGESYQPLPIEPQLVLGVDRETQYLTEHFELSPQASILLYTDGVVECPDPLYHRFGDERLRRSLYGRYDSAKLMLNQVISAVDTFRGTRELDDDLTMVAVQLQPIGTAKPDVEEVTSV
jgi:serine phosphatase RsbU (regulator of sigma subunit)